MVPSGPQKECLADRKKQRGILQAAYRRRNHAIFLERQRGANSLSKTVQPPTSLDQSCIKPVGVIEFVATVGIVHHQGMMRGTIQIDRNGLRRVSATENFARKHPICIQHMREDFPKR